MSSSYRPCRPRSLQILIESNFEVHLGKKRKLMYHPTAQISSLALIEENVEIGAFTIVHSNVKIGYGTKIGSHCEIGISSHLSNGKSLILSARSDIRSHSIFYEGSTFGDDLVTGHRVTVREGVIAGRNLQIGTQSEIQQNCTIGDCVRLNSNVFLAPDALLGHFVWLMPHVLLTNDPHPPSSISAGVKIQDFAVISARSVILPEVCIGKDAMVGANSTVTRDVAHNTIVVGSPAKEIGPTSMIKLKNDAKTPAYPWRRHFHRGYPDDIVQEWRKEFPNG